MKILRSVVMLAVVLVSGLALCLAGEQVKPDTKFLEKTLAQARAGDAMAQCAMGACFESGQGVAKDYAQAVSWYRLAAEQGDAMAQCALGACYENGHGLKKSAAEAASWYARSAAKGFVRAQYLLGGCYAEGKGVNRDDLQAHKWHAAAAAKGYEPAKKALAALEKRMGPQRVAEAKRLEAPAAGAVPAAPARPAP